MSFSVKKTAVAFFIFAIALVSFTTQAEACVQEGPRKNKMIQRDLSRGIVSSGINFTTSKKRVTLRALGNNTICVRGSQVTIVLSPEREDVFYRIKSLSKKTRITLLDNGKSFRSLFFTSRGKNNINLTGSVKKVKIRTKNKPSKINFSGSFITSDIKTGPKNDFISWTPAIIAPKTQSKLIIKDDGGDNSFKLTADSELDVTTGSGRDQISILGKGNNIYRKIQSGFGADNIKVEASGETLAYLSPNKSSNNTNLSAQDNDRYFGGKGIDRVRDYHGNNVIYGGGGPDVLGSFGTASSRIYGQAGNDKIYSAAQGKTKDRLNGGRNNDYIYANRGSSSKKFTGAIIEGGEGDESIIKGSDGDDVIIYRSGVKKILAGKGNDYIIRTSIGRGIIDGEEGRDTLSYMLHSYNAEDPLDPCLIGKFITGIRVVKENNNGNIKGESRRNISVINQGTGERFCANRKLDAISSFERIIGSPEDDNLSSIRGDLYGVAGNDNMSLGGSGEMFDNFSSLEDKNKNQCYRNKILVQCQVSKTKFSQTPSTEKVVLTFMDGWPILIGPNSGAEIEVRRIKDQGEQYYEIRSSKEISAETNKHCKLYRKNIIRCQKIAYNIAFYLGSGNDIVDIDESVPKTIFTTINLGAGRNRAYGGKGDDFISSSFSSTTSWGGDGDDRIILIGSGSAYGGNGDDLLNPRQSPCAGDTLYGGPGSDNVIFVGSGSVMVDYGLKKTSPQAPPFGWGEVSPFSKGEISFDRLPESCSTGDPLSLAPDIEAIEGSGESDYFIGSKTRPIRILGRQGPDIYWTKGNGMVDTITIHGQNDGTHDLLHTDSDDIVYPCFGDSGHIPLGEEIWPAGCSNIFK